MNILITGGNGQLGSELKSCLTSMSAEIGKIPEVFSGAYLDYVDSETLDITNKKAVREWFSEHVNYDAVINCAAMTNVDGCETQEAAAYHVNAAGPENLAEEVNLTGGKFLHVSTDYVFSGTEAAPRVETDKVCPVSAYGRSKLAGELLVKNACPKNFIVRTSWLYGYNGKNFVKTMLNLGKNKDEISVVDDQLGNPTNANDLAYEILKIILTENYGTYHCTGEGICSWYEFASAIMKNANLNCRVKPISSEEYAKLYPNSARRPAYSALENRHLADSIGNEMRQWEEALKCYLSRISLA